MTKLYTEIKHPFLWIYLTAYCGNTLEDAISFTNHEDEVEKKLNRDL